MKEIYFYNVDDRGRITMPSPVRDQFKDGFYLTLSPRGCVLLVERTLWTVLVEFYKDNATWNELYMSKHKYTRCYGANYRAPVPIWARNHIGISPYDEVGMRVYPEGVEVWNSAVVENLPTRTPSLEVVWRGFYSREYESGQMAFSYA